MVPHDVSGMQAAPGRAAIRFGAARGRTYAGAAALELAAAVYFMGRLTTRTVEAPMSTVRMHYQINRAFRMPKGTRYEVWRSEIDRYLSLRMREEYSPPV